MAKRKQQSAFRRFFESRLFLIVMIVLISLIAFSYARAYYQNYKIQKEIKSLQEEIEKLETKKLESIEILEYVTSDVFVEEKARLELNKKKPGEAVVFIEQEVDTIIDSQEVGYIPGRQDIANPVKWWYYFTHKSLPEDN